MFANKALWLTCAYYPQCDILTMFFSGSVHLGYSNVNRISRICNQTKLIQTLNHCMKTYKRKSKWSVNMVAAGYQFTGGKNYHYCATNRIQLRHSKHLHGCKTWFVCLEHVLNVNLAFLWCLTMLNELIW